MICELLLLCHLAPNGPDWHYRTKIDPLPDAKCWYDGPRMKRRKELYWAETPALPPPMVEPGEFELRWKGEQR